MIKNDLNLFAVYKRSSSKSNGGQKGVIIIICSFAFIIVAAFCGIQFYIYELNAQIRNLQSELAVPAVVQNQTKLLNEVNKNQLMTEYDTALTMAKKNFDVSRFIDGDLLGEITSSMPADVTINNITITQLSITMSCTCTNKLAPAIFTQSLDNKNDFVSITYDGISLDTTKNNYSFNLKCDFKEVTPK